MRNRREVIHQPGYRSQFDLVESGINPEGTMIFLTSKRRSGIGNNRQAKKFHRERRARRHGRREIDTLFEILLNNEIDRL